MVVGGGVVVMGVEVTPIPTMKVKRALPCQ